MVHVAKQRCDSPTQHRVGLSRVHLHHLEPPRDRDRKCPKEMDRRKTPGTQRSWSAASLFQGSGGGPLGIRDCIYEWTVASHI